MNDNLKNIMAENKEFIKLIYMFFMYHYRIELKRDSFNFNIDKKITVKLNEELKKRNLLSVIEIEVNSIYDSAYEIIVVDKDKQKWFFEISYANLKKMDLTETHKELNGFVVSNKIKESSLYIITEKQIAKKIDLKNYGLSKEEIDMLCLEHDIITSNNDIKNIIFKNPEMLDFVWDYYGVKE